MQVTILPEKYAGAFSDLVFPVLFYTAREILYVKSSNYETESGL